MRYDPPVELIELEYLNNKYWVKVTFKNNVTWYPKLWEIGAIISGIGTAEDIKYPNGKGYLFTKEFLNECWGKTREEIYELSISEKYDPNGIMKIRYKPND